MSVTTVMFGMQSFLYAEDDDETERDDFFYRIHTYEELKQKLDKYVEKTKEADVEYYRMKAGPLILADRNRDGIFENEGLIEVDVDEMEAIMNTVPGNDDSSHLTNYRWNTKEKFGLSTMGREILAAKIGNPEGRKVLVITQQHGNEFTSTEAALDVLKYLTKNKKKGVRWILDNICLLIIVRANPDGGEPDPDKCVMPTDIMDGVVDVGSPFIGIDGKLLKNCAFYRLNVDPRASTATTIDPNDPESAVFGYFGHGFDLNRYHYVAFDVIGDDQYGKPIYPVENQAMVAAVRAFKPEVILDLHNNNEQIVCDGSIEVFAEQTLWFHSPFSGNLPMVRCNGQEKLVNTSINIAEVGGDPARRLGAHLIKVLDKSEFGSASKFSQSAISLPPDSGVTDLSYGRYEYSDGSPPILFSGTQEVAAIDEFSFSFQTNPPHQIPFVLGGDILPNINKRIALHRKGLKKMLHAIAKGIFEDDALGDNGWDDIPRPATFFAAFNDQFINVISDPWFYIVFGYLNPNDLISDPYAQALKLRGLGGVNSCKKLSEFGLCQSILDKNPYDDQEATPEFQEECRVGLADIYLHNPQKLSIDPIPFP